jgi:hypothetical protein
MTELFPTLLLIEKIQNGQFLEFQKTPSSAASLVLLLFVGEIKVQGGGIGARKALNVHYYTTFLFLFLFLLPFPDTLFTTNSSKTPIPSFNDLETNSFQLVLPKPQNISL